MQKESNTLYVKSGINIFTGKDVVTKITQGPDSLFFFCRKKITEISYQDLVIEVYKNKYYSTAITLGSHQYYLYFQNKNDSSIRFELGDYYLKIGAVLSKISKTKEILLGDRELVFLDKFEESQKTYNSPKEKIIRALIPVVFILTFVFIFYKCQG